MFGDNNKIWLIFFNFRQPKEPIPTVQVFGRKKTATAVAHCKRGNGLIKVNGRPLDLVEPQVLRYKLLEPILLLGQERFVI